MKPLISKTGLLLLALLFSLSSFAQRSNAKTATIKVSGNCDMCQATIEKAGNLKNRAKVDWDKVTKMATITYDSKKTTTDEILKRIALAGYDNEKFLAPNEVYAKLPECCRYERVLKPVSKVPEKPMVHKPEQSNHHVNASDPAVKNGTQLQAVLEHYFSVKEALVKTDAHAASGQATALLQSLKNVEMNKLSAPEHTVWMRVIKDLISDAERIAAAKDIVKQRAAFASLSTNIYELAKVSKQSNALYYQHCPMYAEGKGAHWLSRENAVKNPYYGAQMLTCGKTVETIK